jgi:hypothetical protein
MLEPAVDLYPSIFRRQGAVSLIFFVLVGCSHTPTGFEAPDVNTESAAVQAIELYDRNGDKSLDKKELTKCPGILSKIDFYDQNANGSVEQGEIAQRLSDLLKYGTGGTGLTARVSLNGNPLRGATVVLEPEPYLGDEVQTAQGTTNGSGSAALGIPPEYVPEHLRRLKSVHYGTFKVRITHPTIPIPAKYNTQTELGYETESGNPYVRFALTSK